MKMVKPQRLGVLHRTFEHDRTFRFVPTVMVFFAFDAPDVPLHEAAMWTLVGESVGEESAPDEAMVKKVGELLVSGRAYPPGGKPATACAVRVRLDATGGKKLVDKRLFVVGDRHWEGDRPSEPKPFAVMPISWSRAYGGPEHPDNPTGKGAADVTYQGGIVLRPLPNIENPKEPVTAPDVAVPPSGLGPIMLTSKRRMAYAGTYDKAWLDHHAPGLAPDIDFLFFQTAPPDQWLEAGYFKGGERFRIENMHPERAEVQGSVPKLAPRAFITRRGDADRELHEVKLALDTVHLFPHAERGIAFYRGVIEVQEDDAHDVTEMLLACEAPGEPKPMSHYRDVFLKRLDKEKGAIFALRDRDLLPPLPEGADPMGIDQLDNEMAALLKQENLLSQNMQRRVDQELATARQLLIDNDLDPDEHLPAQAPRPAPEEVDLERLDELLADKRAEAERAQADAEAQRLAAMENARALCAEHDIDFEELVAEAQKQDAGPPRFKADEELQKLRDMKELSENAGVPLPRVDELLADADLYEKLKAAERRLEEAYRGYAHYFPAAARMSPSQSEQVRARVVVARDGGVSLANTDFTGADLRGLSLRGVDMAGAFLEGANLSGTDLAGANLAGAVLARADLTETKLTAANLQGSNLGFAKLHATDLSRANLSQAVLSGAELVDAVFDGAVLEGALLLETKVTGGRFAGIRATQLILNAIDLSGVDLEGAVLPKAIIVEGRLDDANLRGATLDEACLLTVSAERACFDQAQATSFRVLHGCRMAGATFRGAKLERANFRGADLRGASFEEAELSGADLSEADLERAVLTRVVAKEVTMVRTNLKNARVDAANLFQGVLQKATIEGADFRYSNLFRVDFARIRGNVATKLDGANMKLVRFVDRGEHG